MSLGSVAAEVEAPAKTMPKVLAILLPLTTLLNIMPLALSISLEQDHAKFNPGLFDQLASEYYGKWLGWLFLLGAIFCQVGLLNAALVSGQRMTLRYLQVYFPAMFKGESRGWWHSFFFLNDSAGVPRGIMLATNCVSLACCWVPYDVLVECAVMLSCPGFFLLFISYVILKRRDPQVSPPPTHQKKRKMKFRANRKLKTRTG